MPVKAVTSVTIKEASMMRGIGISFAVLLFVLPDGAYGQGGACGLNAAQIQQPPVTPDIDARLQQMTTRLDAIEAEAKRQAKNTEVLRGAVESTIRSGVGRGTIPVMDGSGRMKTQSYYPQSESMPSF